MENPICKCPRCEQLEEEQKQSEEMGLAFLIALMPLMTVILFNNIGLIA
ncbi:MAG: hypothetical protein NTZ97_02265 [Candidatus Moranbacteria bacterium]|nr:hypothetical protein [Candidatus Moranbacteria bacterium]